MNMLAFDPIRAMSCDFLWVLQYLQKCIKRVKFRGEGLIRGEAVQHQTKELDKQEEEEHSHRETITVK